MDLIRTIRKEYGLDFISDDAQASSAIQNLTQNLEQACRRCVPPSLVSELAIDLEQPERRLVFKGYAFRFGTSSERR